jgi:hypothetical protein
VSLAFLKLLAMGERSRKAGRYAPVEKAFEREVAAIELLREGPGSSLYAAARF